MRKNAGNSISTFTHSGRNDAFFFFFSTFHMHYTFSYISKECLILMKFQLMKVFVNQQIEVLEGLPCIGQPASGAPALLQGLLCCLC